MTTTPSTLDATIEAFLAGKPMMIEINPMFADLAKIDPLDILYGPSVNTWNDTQPGKRPAYRLSYMDDDADIVRLGHETFASIKNNLTLRAIGNLFQLAYNLRDSAGRRIFGPVPNELIDLDDLLDFKEIPETDMESSGQSSTRTVQMQALISSSSADRNAARRLATGYCYLACSYMRLYIKPAENYIRIEQQLRKRFRDFYKFPLPFTGFHPDLKAVMSIKRVIRAFGRLPHTFYIFLYTGENCVHGNNLKDFLYRQHVAYTGLHPYSLFVRCLSVLKITRRYFASVIYTHKTESILVAIEEVFQNLCSSENENTKLGMWKYAKIFEDSFLIPLQTRTCEEFTLLLANILYKTDPENHRDIFKISQIANAGELWKTRTEEHAARVLLKINNDKSSGKAELSAGPSN